MKRIFTLVTTIALAFAGLVALEAPANATSTRLADVYGPNGGTITTFVGEEVTWDWMSCGGNDASQLFFESGSFPPGLSWDNGVDYTSTPTGLVTGTPTEAGSWTLSGLSCYYSIGPRSDNVGGGSWSFGSITINVVLPPSPVPTVSIINYASANCDFEVGYNLPEAYEAGSLKLTLTNGASTGEYILYDWVLSDTNVTIGGSLFDNNVVSQGAQTVVTEPSFQCGDTITATITYSGLGKAPASASDTTVVNQPASPAPSLTVTNNDDNLCNVTIRGLIGVAPVSGTAKLVISGPDSEVTVVLNDSANQYEYNLELSMFDLASSLTASSMVTSFALTEGTVFPRCEQTLDFGLSYSQAGHAKASTSENGILVSRLGDAPGITLSVTQPNSDRCEVEISGTFATTAFTNSLRLAIESQNQSRLITLIDYSPGQQIRLMWSPDNADSTTDEHIGSNTGQGPGQMQCGDALTFTLSYADVLEDSTYTSAPVSLTPWVPNLGPTFLAFSSLNDYACNVRVTAAVPVMADSGSLHLVFSRNMNDYVDYALRDYQAGELIDFTISASEWDFHNNRNVESHVATNDYAPRCGEFIVVQLLWSEFGNPAGSNMESVYASEALPWPSTSVTALGGQNCLVAVNVLIPQKGNERNELIVGNLSEGGGYVTFELTDIPITPFTVLVPMSDVESVQSNQIAGDLAFSGNFRCGDAVDAMVRVTNEGDSPYTSMPNMQPVLSYSVCNFGSYNDEGECVPAPVGTFVNTINAYAPVSCPRDFTTVGTGSTSPNDCFKPITQFVKSLKAPKAMKFKAKVALPAVTNSGVTSRVTATGSCTVVTVPIGAKVSGKKVKVPTAVVTATSVAGNCLVTFESVFAMPYTALSKTVTIKVNKKGK